MNYQKKYDLVFNRLKLKHIFLIIFILGLIIYANCLNNSFVIDDDTQISQNPLIQSLSNIPKFFTSSTFYNGSNQLEGVFYRPLMLTAFSLIYSLFNNQVFYYHLFQVLIHILNTFLIFLLFNYFFKKDLAFYLSLIFLIHPINVEAVVYISNLADVLYTFFGLMAILTILKQFLKLNKHWFLLSFLFLSLSLLAKEAGILYVLMSIILIYFYRKDYLVKFIGFSGLLVASYFLIRQQALKNINLDFIVAPISKLSFSQRLLNIPKIINYYLETFIYPNDLAIAQFWFVKQINLANFYWPLLSIFIALITIYVLYKKYLSKDIKNKNIFYIFTIWFLLGLSFYLQIIPLDMTVADRWFYSPMIALLGLAGVFIIKIKSEQNQKPYLLLGYILILVLLSFRTYQRNQDWHDSLTLYKHDIQINPDSYGLQNNLGFALFNIGQIDEAEKHLLKSIELVPNWSLSWNNLGVLYGNKGLDHRDLILLTKAEQAFQKAISLNRSSLPIENLSKLYLLAKEYGKAEQTLNEALNKKPDNSRLWFLLAVVYHQESKLEQAKIAAGKAYQLMPSQEITQLLNFLDKESNKTK